jgi:ubiquinone/menaquinone biosynthesis C-methylase UbiE
MSVHRAARGFDTAADAYDRVRPGYPDAAVQWLAGVLDLGPGRTVLDLAAGTGKLTAALLAVTGARVVAVEPSEPMLALLRGAAPSAEALVGTAEKIPLAGASVDGVTVAQAFHWFANEEALREIHRVLRPGGALALVWNRRVLSAPGHALLEAVMARAVGDTPRHRDNDWSRVLDASPLFERMATHELPNDQELGAEGLVERAASTSFVAAMGEAERRSLLDEVRRRAMALPQPVVLPHACELFAFRARRQPSGERYTRS